MKYVKKIPETNKYLSASLTKEGWRKIKEPSNLFVATLLSIPFMILLSLISFYIIAQFNISFAKAARHIIDTGSFSLTIRFDYIIYLYLVIFSHELIHAGLISNFIKSKNTYFGIRPWGGFVFTEEELVKSRFLLVCIGPYMFISVILAVMLGLLGLLNDVIAFLVLLNALASSVDILNAFLIFFQVPKGSTIVNNGFQTYYKRVN